MDASTWEQRHRNHRQGHPAALLAERRELLPARGSALDIAMGCGENTVFLARHGLQVTGIDRDATGVAQACALAARQQVTITAREADILRVGIEPDAWDVIVNVNFLERRLLPAIRRGLRIGGLLFFETYTTDQTRFGPPPNPDELLHSFSDLFILYYHERTERTRAIASLVARRVD